MSEPSLHQASRGRGRPSFASAGLAAQSERNRRWRAGRKMGVLHVEVPVALADCLKQLRASRGITFQAVLEAALVALEEPEAV